MNTSLQKCCMGSRKMKYLSGMIKKESLCLISSLMKIRNKDGYRQIFTLRLKRISKLVWSKWYQKRCKKWRGRLIKYLSTQSLRFITPRLKMQETNLRQTTTHRKVYWRATIRRLRIIPVVILKERSNQMWISCDSLMIRKQKVKTRHSQATTKLKM